MNREGKGIGGGFKNPRRGVLIGLLRAQEKKKEREKGPGYVFREKKK